MTKAEKLDIIKSLIKDLEKTLKDTKGVKPKSIKLNADLYDKIVDSLSAIDISTVKNSKILNNICFVKVEERVSKTTPKDDKSPAVTKKRRVGRRNEIKFRIITRTR